MSQLLVLCTECAVSLSTLLYSIDNLQTLYSSMVDLVSSSEPPSFTYIMHTLYVCLYLRSVMVERGRERGKTGMWRGEGCSSRNATSSLPAGDDFLFTFASPLYLR